MGERREPADIEGLVLEERVEDEDDWALYRGERDGYTYAVELYVGPRAEREAALRSLRREAALRASIDHPLIPTSFDVGVDRDHPFLIREWVEGRPLSSRCEEGAIGEEMALVIGGAVAGALAALHEEGRIHGRLTPDCVRMGERGEMKLVGAVAPGEDRRRAPVSADRATAYTAPEQVGRVEGAIDSRADVYALGVLLFELVTGRTPGRGDAPASEGGGPSEASPALGTVIRHLVAPEPDERYQWARQVERDLDAIQSSAFGASPGRADLGPGAASGARENRAEFVGREAELSRLRAAWERASEGEGETVLVEGPPGSGKTRLVEEFVAGCEEEASVLVGRCEHGAARPYGPFRGALESYLDELEAGDEETRERAVARLRRAAGDLAGVLGKVSSQLAEVLEADADLLIQRDADEVVCGALASLLWDLAAQSGGLVLWLDDIQWLDGTSLDVLEVLLGGVGDGPLLVVATSRNDPASADALEAVRRRIPGDRRRRVELEPFEEGDVQQFVAQQLGEDLDDEEWIRELADRSEGNPLFVQQDLRALRDAGVLAPEWGTWRVADGALDAAQTPADVLESFVHRIGSLEERTRSVLEAGAVLGDPFELSEVAALLPDVEADALNRAAGRALTARLVEPTGRSGRYTFRHDRVRDALESILQRRGVWEEWHRRAAQYLDARSDLDDAQVHRRAHHYACADPTACDPRRRFRALLRAMEVAAENFAFERAYGLLGQAPDVPDEIGEAGALAYDRLAGRIAFETGRLDGAVEHLKRAIERASEPVERARMRADLARAYAYGLHGDRARREAGRAFEELNFTLPTRVSERGWVAVMVIVWHWVVGMVLTWTGFGEGRAEGEERERCEVLVRLFNVGFLVGYFERNRLFALQSAVCTIRPSHRIGPSEAYSTGFVTYATTMGLIGYEQGVERYGRTAIEAAQEHGGPQAVAKAKQMYSGAKSACGQLREAESITRPLLERDPEWMDASTFLLMARDLTTTYAMRGYESRGLSLVDRVLDRLEAKRAPFWDVYRAIFRATGIAYRASLGQFDAAEDDLERLLELREEIPADRGVPWEGVWGFVLNLHLQKRAFGEEFGKVLRRHGAFGTSADASVHHLKYVYLYRAYARLEMAARPDAHGATRPEADLDEALDELERAASIPTLTAHLRAVEGGRARIRGRLGEARGKLREAEATARERDVPWVLFEVARQRARLFEARDDRRAAVREARRGCELARTRGWSPRVRRLAEAFDLGDRFVDGAGGGEPDAGGHP